MRVRVGPADIYLERGDITDYEVDAIVNAASSDLSMSTGVASTIKRLAESFASERAKLESQWAQGGDVSTEDLRLALRRYRSFFDRLLSA